MSITYKKTLNWIDPLNLATSIADDYSYNQDWIFLYSGDKAHEQNKSYIAIYPSCSFVKNDFSDLNQLSFSLHKNGEIVQNGNSSDMLFSIDKLIAEVSKYFTLKIGDLIYTGTPAGVGAVQSNDLLELYLEGQKLSQLRVK